MADAEEEGRKIIFLCWCEAKKSSVIVHLMFGIFFCNLLEEEKTIINPVCRTANKETTIKNNQNKYSGGVNKLDIFGGKN